MQLRSIAHNLINYINFTSFKIIICGLLFSIASCKKKSNASQQENMITDSMYDQNSYSEKDAFIAIKSSESVTIDGSATENIWSIATWNELNHIWMGDKPSDDDYQGRFKLAWDSNHLYILVVITDDILNPTLKDGIENYWKGDYIEVFIDEDQSGGGHQFNHQAFAYHITTETHVIDLDTNGTPVFLDDYIDVARSTNDNTHLWEIAIQLYDETFDTQNSANSITEIHAGKKIGFSIAYGDNDGNLIRENFMGSKSTHGINNDEGYTNASVFGTLVFR